MWQALFFAISIWLGALPVYAAQKAVGPSSELEAAVIWKDGLKAFGLGDCKSALLLFDRLVKRYPGERGYLAAHFYSGVCHLRSAQPKRAIAPLRFYIQNAGWSLGGQRARVFLAFAYARTNQNTDAILLSEEVFASPLSRKHADLRLESLLARAHAFLNLKQDLNLEKTLNVFKTAYESESLEGEYAKNLKAQFFDLRIAATLRQCEQWPSQKKLQEDIARQEFQRRGVCLLEAVGTFNELAGTQEETWVKASIDRIRDGFTHYFRECRTPPIPNERLSALERKRYQDELKLAIGEDCRTAKSQALDLLVNAQNQKKIGKIVSRLVDDLGELKI